MSTKKLVEDSYYLDLLKQLVLEEKTLVELERKYNQQLTKTVELRKKLASHWRNDYTVHSSQILGQTLSWEVNPHETNEDKTSGNLPADASE